MGGGSGICSGGSGCPAEFTTAHLGTEAQAYSTAWKTARAPQCIIAVAFDRIKETSRRPLGVEF